MGLSFTADEIRDLVEQGYSISWIAKKADVSRQAVYKALQRANLKIERKVVEE